MATGAGSKKRPTCGPPPPSNTQLSPPQRPSSPIFSKYSPPGPSSGKGWTRGRGSGAPSPAERHSNIHKVRPGKGKGRKTQLGPGRDEQGSLCPQGLLCRRACVPAVFEACVCCPHWCTHMCWLHMYVRASPDLTCEILPGMGCLRLTSPPSPSPALAATQTSTDMFRMFSSSTSSMLPCGSASPQRSLPVPSRLFSHCSRSASDGPASMG